MKQIRAALALLITLIACALPAPAQLPPGLGPTGDGERARFGDSRDQVTITARALKPQVRAGEDLPIAVIFEHEENWHSWTNDRELPAAFDRFDGAILTELSVTSANAGVQGHAKHVQWPEPHAVTADLGTGAQTFAVFSGRAIAYLPVTVSPDARPGDATITVSISFQACDDSVCAMPATVELPVTFQIVVSDAAVEDAIEVDDDFAAFDPSVFARVDRNAPPEEQPTENRAATEPPPADAESPPSAVARPTFFGITLPQADGMLGVIVLALLAMLGGFILNLTPCVLPVIPIKIMTISQHAGTPGRSLALGTWMALGVCAFWIAIGVPMAFFASVADPSRIFGIWWLTLGIGVLIGLMGIGIMGLFTLQLPQAVYALNPKADTLWGSFIFGVMTAVLGLPCFGFVAGALLAGAATLPAHTIMIIFTFLGLGMALPYFVLSAKPSLVERIPRTGPASELVKQVMGLLLLAAAAFFVGSGVIALLSEHPYLGRQLHWWMVAAFTVAAGVWLMVRTMQITPKPGPRIVFTIIGVALAGIAVLYAVDSTSKARQTWEVRQAALERRDGEGYVAGIWNDYSAAAVAQAREDGRIVVLDFTAEWCLNCKALKATVLNRDPVKSALAQEDVAAFTVDLTSTKAPGWQLLRDLGQTGIPLLVIFTPGEDEPWQSNAYTSQQVMTALAHARDDQAIAGR